MRYHATLCCEGAPPSCYPALIRHYHHHLLLLFLFGILVDKESWECETTGHEDRSWLLIFFLFSRRV